jgi:hypothetical protein
MTYVVTDPGSTVVLTAPRGSAPAKPINRGILRERDIAGMPLAQLRIARRFAARVLSAIDGRIAALEGVSASDRPPAPQTASERPLSERVADTQRALRGERQAERDADVRRRADDVRAALHGRPSVQ